MKSSLKKIIILVVLIAIAAFVYGYFFKKPATGPASPLSSSTGANSPSSAPLPSTEDQIGQEFLSLLLNLRTLKLDDSIFTDRSFTSLRDYTTELSLTDAKGRVNPFAPIGTDQIVTVSPDLTTTQSSVTTSAASDVIRTRASLNATVTAGVTPEARWFEYGSTTTLDQKTQEIDVTLPFTYRVTSLTPATTYYFKACVRVNALPICGDPLTFTTLP